MARICTNERDIEHNPSGKSSPGVGISSRRFFLLIRVTCLLGLTSVCAATITAADDTNQAFVVAPEYPVASHPQLMLNERTDDPLAARFPWVPEVLYYGDEQSVGPRDVDWLWPDLAVVDWDRDGLLDVVCGLTCGTYWRMPKEVTVHGLGSGSFVGRMALVAGQTSNPKNVPDPFVCLGISPTP